MSMVSSYPLLGSALRNMGLQNWISSMQLKGKIKAFNIVLKLEDTLRTSSPEFLNLSTIDILGQLILYWGLFWAL